MFQCATNTLQKGSVGLARAIYEYQVLGYTVAIPLVDAQNYDLVVEKDGKFQSVQCKVTSQKARSRKGGFLENRYEVGLRTIKTNTKGTVTRKRKERDYDLLFVMCDNGSCFSIPARELPTSGTTVGGPKYKKHQIGSDPAG